MKGYEWWMLLFSLLASGTARAQLVVPPAPSLALTERAASFSTLRALYLLNPELLGGSTKTTPRPVPFDFTRARPHLAFFCRLEINEAAGHVIPAKFRLGGHQHWQDRLLRH